MKLFLMGYKVQNQLQQKEFIAAQTINDAIEYIQDEDCEVFGFSPNMVEELGTVYICLLYTSPSPRDRTRSRMPSSA